MLFQKSLSYKNNRVPQNSVVSKYQFATYMVCVYIIYTERGMHTITHTHTQIHKHTQTKNELFILCKWLLSKTRKNLVTPTNNYERKNIP